MLPSTATLHPGSSIATGPGARCTGGVGFLLTTHKGGGPTHLLTAGHLFPRGAEGADAQVFARAAGEATHVGALALNLLDGPRAVDVALIALSDEGQSLCRAAGPAVLGALDTEGGGPWRARLWRSNKQALSGEAWVRKARMRARFQAALRPEGYALRDLLRTSASLSRHGDSGSPLLTAAARGKGLGLLVGRKGVYGVFEPLDRALRLLGERRGEPLYLVPSEGADSDL